MRLVQVIWKSGLTWLSSGPCECISEMLFAPRWRWIFHKIENCPNAFATQSEGPCISYLLSVTFAWFTWPFQTWYIVFHHEYKVFEEWRITCLFLGLNLPTSPLIILFGTTLQRIFSWPSCRSGYGCYYRWVPSSKVKKWSFPLRLYLKGINCRCTSVRWAFFWLDKCKQVTMKL